MYVDMCVRMRTCTHIIYVCGYVCKNAHTLFTVEQKPNMKKYGNNEGSVTHSGYVNQRFHNEDKRGT